MIEGAWIGHGGKPVVDLPRVIADEFGISRSESRRLVTQGGVSLDGETVSRQTIAVEDLEGRELRVGRRSHTFLSRSASTQISAASTAQRVKVREDVSIVSGQDPCDPAHIWPRSQGGCDDPLCVVPLTRTEHDAYDAGDLDLLPYLVKHRTAELQHALGHAQGSLVRLLERVTGQKWRPV